MLIIWVILVVLIKNDVYNLIMEKNYNSDVFV